MCCVYVLSVCDSNLCGVAPLQEVDVLVDGVTLQQWSVKRGSSNAYKDVSGC